MSKEKHFMYIEEVAEKAYSSIGGLIGLALAAIMSKQAMVLIEIGLVEQELAEIMGWDWVRSCRQDDKCVSTIIDIAETTVKYNIEKGLKNESVDLNTCLAKAKQFIIENYKEIKEYGVPAILLFVNEDGTVNEVRVVAYYYGDMAYEKTICPKW